MDLGIGVTNSEIRFSMRNGNRFLEEKIIGYDATSYSNMSENILVNLKKEIEKVMKQLNPTYERISSIVVAYPMSFNLLKISDLKMLFKELNIDVIRFIDAGMARGLHIYEITKTDSDDKHVCCIGHDKNFIELCLLEMGDGVVETLQSRCFQYEDVNAYSYIAEQINIWKKDNLDINELYLNLVLDSSTYMELTECIGAERTEYLTEYATSRGALIQAERISGIAKDMLPIEIYSDAIECRLNGDEKFYLLRPDTAIPFGKVIKKSTITPSLEEIEIFAINNSTGESVCMLNTTFAVSPVKHEIEFIVDVDSNKNLMVEINTSKSNIRFNY